MKKCYTPLIVLLLTSCGMRINYLGATSTPTQHVDVYVNEGAIKKNYDIVGKGFVAGGIASMNDVNKTQRKSIEIAKANGADAVFFKDYYIPNTGTSIQTTSKVDSIGKGVVAVSNTNIHPTATSGFSIYFLKYK